jgi:hypothetical protein
MPTQTKASIVHDETPATHEVLQNLHVELDGLDRTIRGQFQQRRELTERIEKVKQQLYNQLEDVGKRLEKEAPAFTDAFEDKSLPAPNELLRR